MSSILSALGYFDDVQKNTSQLNHHELVKLSYLQLLENKANMDLLLSPYHFTFQISILERLLRLHVLNKFQFQYKDSASLRSLLSLFNQYSSFQNDDMFDTLKNKVTSDMFTHQHDADYVLFCLLHINFNKINLQSISKYNMSRYAKSFKFMQNDINKNIFSYRYLDVSNKTPYVNSETDFKNKCYDFKKNFSIYMVSMYVLFSALKIKGQSHLIEEAYIDIINESKKQLLESSFVPNDIKNTYVKNFDLYNPTMMFDICVNNEIPLLMDFTLSLLKEAGFKGGGLFGLRKSKLLNSSDKINLTRNLIANI